MIRVVVVDDHPALRAGLRALLDTEPGIVYVGESDGDETSVWRVLRRARPALVLLDYHLPGGDGLQLCHRIKQWQSPPKAAILTAYASPTLALAATIAGADALVAKDVGALDLFDVVRRVNRDERIVPPISPSTLEQGCAGLDADDRALVGLLLGGTTEADAACALRREPPRSRRDDARSCRTASACGVPRSR
jgi:DNA-binding NarL/FixJ family response regulator